MKCSNHWISTTLMCVNPRTIAALWHFTLPRRLETLMQTSFTCSTILTPSSAGLMSNGKRFVIPFTWLCIMLWVNNFIFYNLKNFYIRLFITYYGICIYLIRQEYQVHQGLLDLHHQIMIHQLELDSRQELRNLFHHQPSFEGIAVYQLIDLFKCYQFIFFCF